MTAEKMIQKYNISFANDGSGRISVARSSAADKEWIIAHKAEIVAVLDARKQAEAEAKGRLEAMGVPTLRAIRTEWENYRRAFARAVERGDGRMPAKPALEAEDVAKEYPDAVLYLKAEAYSQASHYAKAGAGSRAVEAIKAGADPAEAVAIMEAEWAAHSREHMWD